MVGILAKKLGMTQIYDDKDRLIPVTVLTAGPCPIVEIKTPEKHQYSALQLAFDEVIPRKANKPRTGHFAKAGVKTHRLLREFRLVGKAEYQVGQVIDVSVFQVGDKIQVTGTSKGKGFAGVIKRHNFHGKDTAHGTPDRVRHPGSIGQGTSPGKVWRGKPMGGHMGDERVSVKGLAVVRIDAERNLLFVKGAVPGGVNGYLQIHKI
ncbi:MAG: 50S ribosomal protein L3 [Candidatus Handelsmanbacteria bacterium]|nr:50S ribosomal protein L3 [Candidatus Handelsmanbacteria bacterium]